VLRFQPQVLRADLGTETSLIGDAHWALRRATDPDIAHNQCWWYGRSVQNQRIESWWAQLTGSTNFVWRKLFHYLQVQGFFTGSTADQVCVRCLYMMPPYIPSLTAVNRRLDIPSRRLYALGTLVDRRVRPDVEYPQNTPG
jgi:hypothetical protein